MGKSKKEVTVDDLQAFADAFNRHDVDAIMTFMTDDCVFEVSWGPEIYGERHVGREAVRAGFSKVMDTYPDAQWNDATHFVAGDRGVSEWRFTGTDLSGQKVAVNGCDVFTFRNGKIRVKNSYRKLRTATG
ncbi:MAG TPA: nuclear transport factor 2 family protein [Gammaproteobacteria bacterium]